MARDEAVIDIDSSTGLSMPQGDQSSIVHVGQRFALEAHSTVPFHAEIPNETCNGVHHQTSCEPSSAADQEIPISPLSTDKRDTPEKTASKLTLKTLKDSFVRPRHLGRSKTSVIAEIIYGSLGCCLTLMFIVLAALAANLNGKAISNYGNHVVVWSSVGPSIYPIIFAAIVARCLKKIACWQAERGTSLGVLERLMGSSSLASSVQAAFSLRRLNPAAVLILFIWFLSPIGGQSSLRLLSTVQRPAISNHPIYYAKSDTTFYIGGSSHYDTTPLATNAIFGASLLAGNSTKHGPTDSWNNPKVPLLQAHIDNIDTIVDDAKNPWIDSPTTSNITYGSLVGLPLLNVPRVGAAHFSMETITIYTDCKRLKSPVTKNAWCQLSQEIIPVDCQQYSTGMTNCGDQSFLMNSSYSGFPLLNATDSPHYVDLQFIGGGEQYLYGRASGFTCNLKSLRLEANVVCDGGQCAVKRVRRSEFDRRPSFLTPWNEFAPYGGEDGAPGYWFAFIEQLSTSVGTAFRGDATPLDNYLYGLDTPFVFNYAFDWHDVPEAVFSKRFTTVVNTFWLASQFPYSVAGDIFQEVAPGTYNNSQQGTSFNATTSSVTNYNSVYHAHLLWVTFLLVISSLLFALSGISAVVGLLTLAPDILGHVSSLIRDDPYVRDHSASWMDGGQQARRLQDLRVRIADSQPESAIGSIVFTQVSSDAAPTSALMRGKLYR